MGRVATFALVALTMLFLLAALLVWAVGSVFGSGAPTLIGAR